jgi:hypothetical protein
VEVLVTAGPDEEDWWFMEDAIIVSREQLEAADLDTFAIRNRLDYPATTTVYQYRADIRTLLAALDAAQARLDAVKALCDEALPAEGWAYATDIAAALSGEATSSPSPAGSSLGVPTSSGDEGERCGFRFWGFNCVLAVGHEGEHAAYDPAPASAPDGTEDQR